MPGMKLTYFDGMGRAEIIRLVAVAGGVKLEDTRITFEDWPALKPKTESGQLPILEIDGKEHAQSVAIANYIARESGLYGKNNLDGLVIDQVMGTIQDVVSKGVKFMFEKDPEKKAEGEKDFKEDFLPKIFKQLDNLLKKNKSGFFVGESMSLADIAVMELVTGMFAKHMCDMKDCPMVQKLVDNVGSSPKIKEYMANRKETNF